MAAGRVVFDGAPEALTDDVARDLYGLEAGDVMDAAPQRADARAVGAAAARLSSPALTATSNAPHQPSTREIASCSPVVIVIGRRRRRSPLAATAAFAQDWKAKYPELVFAVVPAENASGVDRALRRRSSTICPRSSAPR